MGKDSLPSRKEDPPTTLSSSKVSSPKRREFVNYFGPGTRSGNPCYANTNSGFRLDNRPR